MSFNINSNIPSLINNLNMNQNASSTNKTLGALSSGHAINSAADNASGLAIANGLSSLASMMGQTIMNANDSIGMIQVADGAMAGITDNTEQIRNLSMKASSPIMNAGNRASIQNEINGLMESSNQIASTTSYNGNKLLSGNSVMEGVGALDARSSALFGSPINVLSQESAVASLETIDAGLANINTMRSSLGASQNQHESTIRSTSVAQVNAASAESNIRDTDFALESANFSRENIMSQTGSFVQSQINASQANTMRLLQ